MNLSRALRIQRQDVIALVGGGGKTSAMFRLGDELAAQGWRVITTTSTHIGANQVALAPHAIILPGQAMNTLTEQNFSHSPTLLVGQINPHTNRADGLGSDVIDHLPSALGADAVINEADGARTLPFKAPAAHEPVITPGTTLVVPIVGIDIVGQPLDGMHVHRPERITALTGAQLGQAVTPEVIAAVLTHHQGGLKGVPPRARVVVLVNKVQTAAEDLTADHLADLLLQSPRISAVAIGAVREPDPIRRVRGRVGIVVLAAGESRRFGRLKQLLPWADGETLLSHAADVALASRLRPVVVVLGCQADACRDVLGDRPLTVATNANWAQGQSTSVRAGLAALPENIDAVVFHLADLPGVTPAVIDALKERYEATQAPVVWPEYNGRRGNPTLFDRVAFPALDALKGDVGGKQVLLAYARSNEAEHVDVEEPGVLQDIDSPEDLPLR